MYQPAQPSKHILETQIQQLYNYYQNLVNHGNNLYSMQFQILPDRPEMLQLQMYFNSSFILYSITR